MNKDTLKIIRAVIAIAIGVIGLITFVFAILRLAQVNMSDPGAVLIIVGGIALTTTGIAFLILSLLKTNEKQIVNYRDLLVSALFLGFGIFCFLEPAKQFVDLLVMLIVPLVFVCFGGGLLIKSIINIVKKQPAKKIIPLILGSIVLIIAGVLFVCYYKENSNLSAVIWLLVGLGMMAVSIVNVVLSLKKPSDKSPTQAAPVQSDATPKADEKK